MLLAEFVDPGEDKSRVDLQRPLGKPQTRFRLAAAKKSEQKTKRP
jgi:hypothetical protein